MEVYATEEETVAAVKKWVKENGMSIITGVLLGLAAVAGWRTWLEYQASVNAEAASGYAATVQALQQNMATEAIDAGGKVVSEFAKTPYAAYASMAMAKADLTQGNINAAVARYEWAMENAQPEVIRHIARQHLIRVLLAQGSLAEAEQMLAQAGQPADAAGVDAFSAGYQELKGDLLKARGDIPGAAKAYQSALEGVSPDQTYRTLLELKYDAVKRQADKGQG